MTIFIESAHDAQNAAVLTSRALVRPRPPIDSGKLAVAFADQGAAGVPRTPFKHSQTNPS